MIETQVLVVGAGPTGLTLAIDLGHRGIQTLLVERHETPLFLPKMERTNPRSMEIFRRLGIADQIRAVGYPSDVPMDTFIVTSLADPPLLQLRYPSINDSKNRIAQCHDGSLPREPYQLVSQYALEPVMLEKAEHTFNVTVRQGLELISFEQDESGIKAYLRRTDGTEETVRAQFMAACDGGGSTIRKQLGIKLEGDGPVSAVRQVFFRCDEFYGHCKVGAGRHYSFAGQDSARGGVGGVIVVQGDRRHFTLQTTAPLGTDWVREIRAVTGLDIEPEILFVNDWRQSYMLAERYDAGRVLLAGDAAHLFIPAGGLGMNTGVGDAYDLSWKMAATVQGWGGPALLRSYEVERRAVGARNIGASSGAVAGVLKWRSAFSNEMTADSHEGRAARHRFAELAEPLNRLVYEMHGTELGYRYASPVIYPEDGTPPPDESYTYRPTTWPGARLPHLWQTDGTALHDRLGLGFTLLRLNAHAPETSKLESALRDRGARLDVLSFDDPRMRQVYERDLVLVRPDLHVCWRGDSLPVDPEAVARIVTGHGTAG